MLSAGDRVEVDSICWTTTSIEEEVLEVVAVASTVEAFWSAWPSIEEGADLACSSASKEPAESIAYLSDQFCLIRSIGIGWPAVLSDRGFLLLHLDLC